jgi:predicted acylesterase/phospholipase RssA
MAKALILSGGGAKGAFTIGALNVLQEMRGQLDFDIISGTSTGSLIAALLAANRLDLLRKIYLSVDNTNIVNSQNIVNNIRNDIPYLISDAPLRTVIDREITSAVATSILSADITLLLTAVSLQTGKITVFSNKKIVPTTQSKYNYRQLTTRAELLSALSASSNQFAFLPPMPINVGGGRTEQMIDGGVRDTIPTKPVFEIEPDPAEIVVLSNNPLSLFQVNKNYTSPIDILMRGISIFIQDVRENDLQVLNDWKAQTGKDYILIQPDADLDEAFPTGLRFERQRMADMMVSGERKAREILSPQPVAMRTIRALPRRGVVAPPRTSDLTGHSQCKGKTKDGTRCKNRVAGRAGYCHLHLRV